jgi:uncharacterized membrane protein YedE/YeeE
MITPAELLELRQQVIGLGLFIGIAFGAISQATRFCTLGAIADWVVVGNRARMQAWWVAMAAAVLATQALLVVGLLDNAASFYTASRLMWASNLIGGLVFGAGMVLASGCGVRTLVRIGEGSLKAVVVFLVMSLAALMTIRGLTAIWRSETVERLYIDLGSRQDLPTLLFGAETADGPGRMVVAMVLAGLLLLAAFWKAQWKRSLVPMLGALVLGLLIAAGWATTGWLGFLSEHPDTLEAAFVATNSRSPESLTFVGPLAYSLELLLYWSDRSQTITFAIATVLGTTLGSLGSALARGRFKLDGFKTNQDLLSHLVGAVLMGVGGVMAMGCTIGHGMSGLSLLALGSIISLLGIVAGAWATLKALERV